MSFLSALKSIGHVLVTGIGVATAAAPITVPILTTLNPAAGALFTTILSAVTAVEGLVPASGTGAAKKAAVTNIVTAVHPTADPAQVSSLIDGIVSALNQLQKVMGAAGATGGTA